MEEAGFSSSVFSGMKAFSWDSEEAVAYEAAIEAISAAIGFLGARIHAEEQRAQPEQGLLEELKREQAACARRRDTLDPTDRELIASVRAQYTAVVRREAGGGD